MWSYIERLNKIKVGKFLLELVKWSFKYYCYRWVDEEEKVIFVYVEEWIGVCVWVDGERDFRYIFFWG